MLTRQIARFAGVRLCDVLAHVHGEYHQLAGSFRQEDQSVDTPRGVARLRALSPRRLRSYVVLGIWCWYWY